jgi:putative molybdopterin biosynthesis protein
MSERKIFKTLISAEEALKRLEGYCRFEPVGVETVSILEARGRILAEDVVSVVDVPGFDRASMDGYAVKAADTFGAKEDQPASLHFEGSVQPGENPIFEVEVGKAVEVGTGASIPRGANAVVMVEYTQSDGDRLNVFRPVAPGENIMSAGSDIMTGELVIRQRQLISPREVGVLAAIGRNLVRVYRKPLVAIISTGNELVNPGEKLNYGQIYDINSNSIYSSIYETGGIPLEPCIVRDDPKGIEETLADSLRKADIVLTSGSTSAGTGDILYRIIDKMGSPGILAHGLNVKPGKPTVLAVIGGKPIIGLPGYPTSAMMIFHLIAAPLIRRMAGLSNIAEIPLVGGRAATRIFSAKGRRELLPVHVISLNNGYSVYSVGRGSGAISSMAMADGYIDIPKNQEFVEEGEVVQVNLFSTQLHLADIIIMGSHCIGVDLLLQKMIGIAPNISPKVINNGSIGGFRAVERGEADIAGVHLLDEASNKYNMPFFEQFKLKGKALLVRGYDREQGIIVNKGNPKGIWGFEDLLQENVMFINRNAGSGTRILIDLRLKRLAESKGGRFEDVKRSIRGYDIEAKSHSAIGAAVAQGRADAGVGIRPVAHFYDLGFIPVADEKYDFLISRDRAKKNAVKLFLSTLRSDEFKKILRLKMPGLKASSQTGAVLVDGGDL